MLHNSGGKENDSPNEKDKAGDLESVLGRRIREGSGDDEGNLSLGPRKRP